MKFPVAAKTPSHVRAGHVERVAPGGWRPSVGAFCPRPGRAVTHRLQDGKGESEPEGGADATSAMRADVRFWNDGHDGPLAREGVPGVGGVANAFARRQGEKQRVLA